MLSRPSFNYIDYTGRIGREGNLLRSSKTTNKLHHHLYNLQFSSYEKIIVVSAMESPLLSIPLASLTIRIKLVRCNRTYPFGYATTVHDLELESDSANGWSLVHINPRADNLITGT